MPDDKSKSAKFDVYAQSYDHELDHVLRRFVDSGGNYFIRLKCTELYNLAIKYDLDPAQLTVVDAGCGTGIFERILSSTFHRLIGLDLSAKMLKVAVESNSSTNNSYICCNAQTIPLPDSSAEIVFSSSLFHHMPAASLVSTLQELGRVCKSGGYVICFEHNPLNPLTQLVVRTTPLDRDAQLIPHSRLSAMFKEAGFQVVEHRFILFSPEQLDRFVYRLGEWVYRLPLGGQYLVVGRKC